MNLLKLSLLNVSGYPDVSCTTRVTGNGPEYGWVDESIQPPSVPHRVAMLPLRITNPTTTDFVGPSMVDNPTLFTKDSIGFPMLTGAVRVGLLTAEDDLFRELTLSVPFAGLVGEDGRVRIPAGGHVIAQNNLCLLDITGWFSGRAGNLTIEVQLDPLGMSAEPGGYCNVVIPCKIYRFQLRHGADYNIP